MKLITFELYTVMLEDSEKFYFETPTGKIVVDEIAWAAGGNDKVIECRSTASLKGWAVRVDGSMGYIKREAIVHTSSLPKEVRSILVTYFERKRTITEEF